MGQDQSNSGTPPTTVDKDPKPVVRAWKAEIRKAQRQIDRQMREIQTAANKTQQEIRKCIKDGDQANAKILAKEIVRSRKAVDKLYTSRTHLSMIISELDHQLAVIRTTQTIQSATGILQHMNEAIKVPELAAVCFCFCLS